MQALTPPEILAVIREEKAAMAAEGGEAQTRAFLASQWWLTQWLGFHRLCARPVASNDAGGAK